MDADGETPLDWARSFGYAEIIQLLREVPSRESGASKRDELRRAS
jgi:hypothetical protein